MHIAAQNDDAETIHPIASLGGDVVDDAMTNQGQLLRLLNSNNVVCCTVHEGHKRPERGVTNLVNTQDSQEQAPCATYGFLGPTEAPVYIVGLPGGGQEGVRRGSGGGSMVRWRRPGASAPTTNRKPGCTAQHVKGNTKG
eukprot:1195525-Prorocentrum_minimum.AAC.6